MGFSRDECWSTGWDGCDDTGSGVVFCGGGVGAMWLVVV